MAEVELKGMVERSFLLFQMHKSQIIIRGCFSSNILLKTLPISPAMAEMQNKELIMD